MKKKVTGKDLSPMRACERRALQALVEPARRREGYRRDRLPKPRVQLAPLSPSASRMPIDTGHPPFDPRLAPDTIMVAIQRNEAIQLLVELSTDPQRHSSLIGRLVIALYPPPEGKQ